MPFSDRLKGFISKAEAEVNKYTQSHNAQQPINQGGAPPIPQSSKPPLPQGASYWAPHFTQDGNVAEHFKHETGQHGWGNNEAQNYTSDPTNSFFTSDGAVHVVALINHGESENARKFTSARLSSHQTLARDRGCLSARISGPSAPGIWPAFWLLPQDPFTWPTDGEIDICEFWNADKTNHSCLHWGMFDGPDHDKHRVIKTPIPGIDGQEGVRFDFAWDEGSGKLIWYIDGRPVMKALKPQGTRRLADYRILINVAVGGNVNAGAMPGDGRYEMVVRELMMGEEAPGGWGRFEQDFGAAAEGGFS